MVACALDMVMAGTETTASTLQWAALLMCKHPEVQGKRSLGRGYASDRMWWARQDGTCTWIQGAWRDWAEHMGQDRMRALAQHDHLSRWPRVSRSRAG